MSKVELIEKYGIEWYEAQNERNKAYFKTRYNDDPEFREAYKARRKQRYDNDHEFREARKARSKARQKERYNNDPEFREAQKAYMRELYCRAGELERIENYELAKADNFKGWDIHHRLELTLDGEFALTHEQLKMHDMYYNRPYYELIFLTKAEHRRLHKQGTHISEETRRKLSEANKGKHWKIVDGKRVWY